MVLEWVYFYLKENDWYIVWPLIWSTILDFVHGKGRVAGLSIDAKKNKYHTFSSQGHLMATIVLYHQENAQV